jgi:hypothetical protein
MMILYKLIHLHRMVKSCRILRESRDKFILTCGNCVQTFFKFCCGVLVRRERERENIDLKTNIYMKMEGEKYNVRLVKEEEKENSSIDFRRR